MSQTIQTLSEFKEMAIMTHDNSETAAKNWSKGWGLGYSWFELWRYKEYTLGTLKYRTGKVVYRHGSESVTRFYINNESVSRKAFFKAANEIEFKPKVYEPIEVKPHEVAAKKQKPKYVEGDLFHDVA